MDLSIYPSIYPSIHPSIPSFYVSIDTSFKYLILACFVLHGTIKPTLALE